MRTWHGLLFIGLTAAGCGGRTTNDSDGDPGPGPDSGGAAVGTGGADGGLSGQALPPSGGAQSGGAQSGGAQSGGQGPETGGAGGTVPDDCNQTLLWFTVAERATGGLGTCDPSYCDHFAPPTGGVTIDADGRAIDVTGLGVASEEWLAEVADERWPCLAGQTLGYCCNTQG